MKKNKQIVKQNTFTEFLLYTTSNGNLFNVQGPTVTKHLKNIFESGELQENLVSSILEHTAVDL